MYYSWEIENMYTPENPPPPVERVCPKCGRVLKREWNACPDCGWKASTHGVQHGTAVASIACAIVGFFIFGVFFGLIAIGLGASAVMRRDKDNLGYAGLVLGVVVLILSVVVMIVLFRNPYYYW